MELLPAPPSHTGITYCEYTVGIKYKIQPYARCKGVFENVCSKSMEWSVPMWYASLDLRKAFDRIDYNALFNALKVQGVPFAYLKLLPSLYHTVSYYSMYHDQVGLVQGRQFPIKAHCYSLLASNM